MFDFHCVSALFTFCEIPENRPIVNKSNHPMFFQAGSFRMVVISAKTFSPVKRFLRSSWQDYYTLLLPPLPRKSTKAAKLFHMSSCSPGSISKLGGVSGNVREMSAHVWKCCSAFDAHSDSSGSFSFSSTTVGLVSITAQLSSLFVSLSSSVHIFSFFCVTSSTFFELLLVSSWHASKKEYCRSRKDWKRVGNNFNIESTLLWLKPSWTLQQTQNNAMSQTALE